MTLAPESPIRVPADWPRQRPCKLAFVAEAPGEYEIGWTPNPKPLVGPSGVVFNQLLRAANIDRAEVLVTNVYDQKAPGNDVGPWMRDEAFTRPYLSRLANEIEKSDPALIVTLGSASLWALTGETNVGQHRGSPFLATRTAVGRKIVPTYHPSFVQRTWKMFGTVVADFVKAAALAEKPRSEPIGWSKREIWIEPTLSDLMEFEDRFIAKADFITIDIETMPGARQIKCVGFGVDAVTAIVVPFVDWRKPSRSYWNDPGDEVKAWAWVERQCASPKPKLMQNGVYDAFWLWDRMGIAVMNYSEDTRLIHHVLYPELPKSLEYMGGRYLVQQPWKRWGRRKEEKRDA